MLCMCTCMYLYDQQSILLIIYFYIIIVHQKRKGASEVRWLKTVLSSGTLSDKMAALTLLVQVSVCVIPRSSERFYISRLP